MQVLYPRCCGLDVHKKTVVACVLLTDEDGVVHKQVRTFQTMMADLLALSDWLTSLGISHLAMESTGIYWRPLFNVLEAADRTILLVNAQHVKGLPGRKTDVKDSEWLADLLRHGLLKPSFLPPAPIRALRDLTRYRKTLVTEQSAEINRLHKVLESANLKLASVASAVTGVSGRLILDAVVAGQEDALVLADLARGRLRAKLPELRRALEGRVQPHQRVLIERHLAHLDFLAESLRQLQLEIDRLLQPYQAELALLQTIPGVGPAVAAAIIAEVGVDMTRFASSKHLASWAGLCPGNHQSAGRQLTGKRGRGDTWLRAMLGEVAWVVAHQRDNYLAALFQRMARRRGRYKAAVAVAHAVLVIAYHMLRDHEPYRDLGADYFDQRNAERLQRHHVRRLQQLGYDVTLTERQAS